ncbi:MAG: Zn-dependent hydrolase [Verrucomicrobiaceae bacterium]|nr:Zn-dependent hydrolase [Verrucomicrobiaceae bacterium]
MHVRPGRGTYGPGNRRNRQFCTSHRIPLPFSFVIYHNHVPQKQVGLPQILRWKLGMAKKEAPHPALASLPAVETSTPVVATDLQAIHAPADPSRLQVTWIGHSSFLIQHHGRNVLTDPVFGHAVTQVPGFRVRRESSAGLRMEDLPPVHEVLISHNHYDHLDAATVKRLARSASSPRFWVPSGLSAWFRRKGIAGVQELAWGESQALEANIQLHCVPAQHFAARTPFDRDHTHWCGWVLRSADRTLYFAGDTGYNSSDFKALGERFGGMDLSLIPIGAYRPRWIMKPVHADPFEAVQIHEDVRSKRSIGCHWGTFRLTDEPLHEPPALLNIALAEKGISPANFSVLALGETVVV